MTVLFTLLATLLVAQSDAEQMAVATIAAGIETRQSQYSGLKFSYDVIEQGVNNGQATHDTYKVFRDTVSPASPQHICWERRIQDSSGTWILDEFRGWDGAELRSCDPLKLDLKQEVDHREAVIVPWYNWPHFVHIPLDRFLFDSLYGASRSIDPDRKASGSLANIRPFKINSLEVDTGKTVYVLAGAAAEAKARFQLRVTGDPDFMILRAEVYVKGELLELLEVSDVGKFEEVSYPRKGRFYKAAGEVIPGREYSFEVTSVERLPVDSTTAWFPPWPSGTYVMDQVRNENIAIPHDAQQLSEMRLKRRLIAVPPSSVRGNGRLILLSGNAVAAILILYLWRRSKRHQRLQ